MALQVNLPETNVGLPAPEGYARIVALAYDLLTGKAQVAVNIYANQAAREAGKNPVAGGVFEGKPGEDMPSLDADIPGVRAALYGWLKTLPVFASAIDV